MCEWAGKQVHATLFPADSTGHGNPERERELPWLGSLPNAGSAGAEA